MEFSRKELLTVINFLKVTFMLLDHFRVLLLVLITSWSTLAVYLSLKEIQKIQEGWPPFGNHDVIPTGFDVLLPVAVFSFLQVSLSHF